MDEEVVKIIFEGYADPLLAQITRVRDSLKGLRDQASTDLVNIQTKAPQNEVAFTQTVEKESKKRVAIRQSEADRIKAQYEESISRASFLVNDSFEKDLKRRGVFLAESTKDYDKFLATLKSKWAAANPMQAWSAKSPFGPEFSSSIEQSIQTTLDAQKKYATEAETSERELTNVVKDETAKRRVYYREEADALSSPSDTSALVNAGRGRAKNVQQEELDEIKAPKGGWFSNLSDYQKSRFAGSALRGVPSMGELTNKPVGGMLSGFGNMASSLSPFGFLTGNPWLAGGLAATAVGTNTLEHTMKVGENFEDASHNFGAQTNIAKEDLGEYNDMARKLARTFGVDVKDSFDAMRLLVNAFGLDLAKNKVALEEMTTAALGFAKAGHTTVPDATQALLTTFNQMGYNIDGPGGAKQAVIEFNKMLDVMAAGATRGQLQINQMTEAMRKVGGTAQEHGLSMEETVSALEVAGKAGLAGQETGTALRNILVNISGGVKPARDAIQSLGLTVEEVNPKLVPFGEGLRKIKNALDAIESPVQRGSIMTQLFGRRNANVADVMMNNLDTYDQIKSTVGQPGSAKRMAQENMDTVSGQEARLKATIEDIFIDVFTNKSGDFKMVVGDLKTLVDDVWEHRAQIGTAVDWLIKLIDKILVVGMKVVDIGSGIGLLPGQNYIERKVGSMLPPPDVTTPIGMMSHVTQKALHVVSHPFETAANLIDDPKKILDPTTPFPGEKIPNSVSPVVNAALQLASQNIRDAQRIMESRADDPKIVQTMLDDIKKNQDYIDKVRFHKYSKGDYTGEGDPNDIAGVVHKEEFVFSAPAVRRIGLRKLREMHNANKGFKSGGWTGDSFEGDYDENEPVDPKAMRKLPAELGRVVAELEKFRKEVGLNTDAHSKANKEIEKTASIASSIGSTSTDIMGLMSGDLTGKGAIGAATGAVSGIGDLLGAILPKDKHGKKNATATHFDEMMGGLMPLVQMFMPFLAKGTDDFPGGMAVVGDAGPEILHLPRHSRVIPNNKIQNYIQPLAPKQPQVNMSGVEERLDRAIHTFRQRPAPSILSDKNVDLTLRQYTMSERGRSG